MSLVRVIYTSLVARHVRFSDAELIAERAAELNSRSELTGLLVYTPSHFIQVLEGHPTGLDATLARIRRDERHTRIRVIERKEIAEREFGRWAMKVSMLPQVTSVLALDELDGPRALELLRSCT